LHNHITVSTGHLCGIMCLSTRLAVVVQALDEFAVILSRQPVDQVKLLSEDQVAHFAEAVGRTRCVELLSCSNVVSCALVLVLPTPEDTGQIESAIGLGHESCCCRQEKRSVLNAIGSGLCVE
jgi:hypothetical protein